MMKSDAWNEKRELPRRKKQAHGGKEGGGRREIATAMHSSFTAHVSPLLGRITMQSTKCGLLLPMFRGRCVRLSVGHDCELR